VSQTLNNQLIIRPNPELHPEDITVLEFLPVATFTHTVTVVSV